MPDASDKTAKETDHAGESCASSRPPRITIIGPVYPHRGGIAHYTACLARALSEKGCNVQLISYHRLYPRWLFPGRSEFDLSNRPADFPSQPIVGPLNPLRWAAAFRAVMRHSPDLVLVAWWHAWFLPWTVTCLAWLRWAQQRRVALLCHNLASHDRRAADGFVWPLLGRLPDVHIVHASGDPALVLHFNRKAHVVCVPHPEYDFFRQQVVDPAEARRALGLTVEDQVCLCFGLVRRYKGVDVAIEAMGLLRDRRQLRLLVAGEFYEPRDQYERLIKRLDLGAKVILHDRYVPNEQVALYFSAADLLVAPYRAISHSGVAQIARAFSLPAVASDVGGMRDLIQDGETGLLAPPADAKALAGAIARYFDQGLGRVFRQNLQAQTGRFSWANLANTILGLI